MIHQWEKMKSDWVVVAPESGSDKVTIRDMNGRTSVTNDAENVVAYLVHHYILKEGQRLFYYDSEGHKDEMLWDKEQGFIGFQFCD